MGELVDIYGFFPDDSGNFQKNDQWIGTLLIDKNDCFEGIAENYSGVKYFVFGKKDQQSLSIIRCAIEGDPSFALVFNTKKNPMNSKYQGVCSLKAKNVKYKLGNCKISLRAADQVRDVTSSEVVSLKTKICACKEYLMEYQSDLYNSFQNKREKTVAAPNVKIKK